jgi:Putative Ig domain
MTTRLTVRYTSDLLVVTTIFLAMFLTPSAFAANIPMEIIQPQPGLTITNRYYKAYPNIEYNVKVGVLGGTFPFVYSLTTKPTGMTINADTGVITWPIPTTSGSPHNVTVSVKDAENTTVTRSWTVTVTTSGFYFLDAVTGNDSNNGSLSSPWKTMAAWDKGDKNDTTYKNAFLYYRAGTYYTRAAGVYWEDSGRLPLYGGGKPNVWLGYPGETAVIDVNGAHIAAYYNSYFDKLDIRNNTDFGIRVASSGSNLVVRRINFSNIGLNDTSMNQSGVMISNGGDTRGTNKLISENTCNDMTHAYCLLGYSSDKVVVEYNTMTNMTGKHGIAPKANVSNWSIRKNTAVTGMNTLNVLWLGLATGANGALSFNMDISFNNIKASSGTALSVGAEGPVYGPVYSYNNTYMGKVIVLHTDGSTPVSFVQDTMSNPPRPAPPIKLLIK